jgi:3-deoxy-D-manno-octulosonic-acid transferase
MERLPLRVWRIVYQLLLLLAFPWVHVRLRWRARKEPAYGERIEERFGYLPAEIPRGPVWFHTVSAGETIAAAPVIAALVEEFPEIDFLVTTLTPTGSAQVSARLAQSVAHCYAPYDFRWGVRRFFARVEPRLLVLMETELWPNMLAEARQLGIPALLANARLSERSAAGYARLGPLTRQMLIGLKFIACQYPDHAERFRALGAAPAIVSALGSVKFDVTLPSDHEDRVAQLMTDWSLTGRPIWVAGSTHPGEDEIVLEAHRLIRERFPAAVLLLVPRHPARAGDLAALIGRHGFTSLRQSKTAEPVEAAPDVILADTMGQLLYLYGLSSVAFLGGSLVSVGGHNPIEAAICGQPLIMGPETFNFSDVVAAFSDAGCLTLVADAAELAKTVLSYFVDEARTLREAQTARLVVVANTGGTERLLALLRAEIQAVV